MIWEWRLQDDEFWYFLTNETVESNRLEFVLNQRAKDLNDDLVLWRDKAALFLIFNQQLKNNESNVTTDEWGEGKNAFPSA